VYVSPLPPHLILLFASLTVLQVFLIFLRIVSLELNPFLPAHEKDIKYSSVIQNRDIASMTILLEENLTLKTLLKNVRKTESTDKQVVMTADGINLTVETALLSQIVEIIKSLTLQSILKLPHIMDILALLGDNNITLGTELLARLYVILELKIDGDSSVASTELSTYNSNPIFGIQLERIIEEVEIVSKQIHSELSKMLSMLCVDQSEEEKKENDVAKNKSKFKCVDLSASKLLKNPKIEEKLKAERRILELQSKAKNNSKSQKNLQLGLITEKIIDQYQDLVLYLVDIVYSFSVFFQSAAAAHSHNGEKKFAKNVLSLTSIFCNLDNVNAGYFLSEKTGKSIISTFQYIYEEVNNNFCPFVHHPFYHFVILCFFYLFI
jgi:hypothetical protein